MNMPNYTKLFDSIITSTIWSEAHETRIVWITMLALADQHGEVHASIPGLARVANVPIECCEEAVNKFLAPDKYSRTPDQEGRRIGVIAGGWELLNHAKYRNMASREDAKVANAERVKRYRVRNALPDQSPDVTVGNGDVTVGNAHVMVGNGDVMVGVHIADTDRKADNADSEASKTERKTSAGSPLPPPLVEAKPQAPKPPKPDKPDKPDPAKGPLQLRAEALVNRRPATPATKNELTAFRNSKAAISATPEEDWVLLERFYKLPQDQTFSRHHLAALVNNWNGEIDKARSWFKQNPSSYQSPPKPLTCLPEPANWREFVASDMPTCPYAPGMPNAALPWPVIPREHQDSLISSMNRSKATNFASVA